MNKVFMIMPFSDSTCKKAYKNCIKPVCDEYNLEIRRADEIFTTNPVYDDIVKEIQEASIIIVDISGKNPNVFYELGMAHTLKQSHTIIITHQQYKDTPFDIAHFRTLHYEDSIEGAKKLENQLRRTLEHLLKDYKTLYQEEYDLVAEVLSSAGKHSELYAFLGISKYKGFLRKSMVLYAEGHNQDNSSSTRSITIENGMKTFIKMGYVIVENDFIKLSDKGEGFADSLVEKGFVCDMMNDQIFTDGFKPFYEKLKEQQQQIKRNEIK